jgi:hypothetical protein
MPETEKLRARVFISCGQRKDSDEPEIAQRIAARLTTLGYDPYVAVQRQSLRSIRENIFAALRDSEYFLFVDFPRERLIPFVGTASECRGSLFSHQELAIASYLDMESLVFREEGVRDLEGIMGHLQANSTPFADRSSLPELVAAEVQKRWNPGWRNTLHVALDSESPHRATIDGTDIHGQFFLLRVDNRHRSTAARDCTAYIKSVTDIGTGEALPIATAELKWAGVSIPTVSIMPSSHREVDGVWIPESAPNQPQFSVLTDSTRHVPRLRGPGRWLITYLVVSSNVPGATCSLELMTDGTVAGSRLRVPGEPSNPSTQPSACQSALRRTPNQT